MDRQLSKPTISLVLGGGGARGFAHIGVIQVLKTYFQIKSIAGTSIGALIGAMEALGKLEQFEEWAKGLKTRNKFGLLKWHWRKLDGVKKFTINIDKLFAEMDQFFQEKKIEQLPISFTAVAVDLNSKREVWLQQGDLKEAVRASVAIPQMIPPVYRNGQVLVDGGILNLLPIAPVIPDRTDLIVAVNLYGDDFSITIPPHPHPNLKAKFWDSLFRSDLVVEEAIYLMMETLMKYRKVEYRPDIQIKIPRHIGKWYEFYYIDYFISVGKAVATQVINNYIEYQLTMEQNRNSSNREIPKKWRPGELSFFHKLIKIRNREG